MLQASAIGNLGGDVEVKTANGQEFITFRIAHTDRWTDASSNVHEATTWVDCIMNGVPKVTEFLKRGQQVYVTGSVSLRIYSSKKDRCMKPGLTINVRSIELLGGKTDSVPAILYNAETGAEVKVSKYYHAADMVRGQDKEENVLLLSRSNVPYLCNRDGWVSPDNSQSDVNANEE